MKKSFVKIRLMISIIILAGLYPANLFSQDDYQNFWRQVEAIEKQGKPRSAIEVVNEIYSQAKKEKNEPQMLKALEYSIRLSMKYEEDYLQKGIARIDTE
ncbi:MAG: hypothetical protein ABFS05_13350, partial [Bacteroidota bacterium]